MNGKTATILRTIALAAATLLVVSVAGFAQQPAAPIQTRPEIVTPAATPPATARETTIGTTDTRSARALLVPAELSPWSMFMSADWIVKAVMIGLTFASLLTWTIFAAKSFELFAARRRVMRDLAITNDARSLAEAQRTAAPSGVMSAFLSAALHEARQSQGLASDQGIKERAASNFTEIMRSEARRIRLGMGLLATIGSTSPFVGLFGTVWGIMNSFIGISKSQTTNLAVVAPGIAEALLATAIGLVAAIPAVIIYNHFSRVTKAYLETVSRASGASARLLSRDLDRSHGAHMMARAAE